MQDYQEYVQSKWRHTIDFQMKMTDTPFCQYTKTKVRDKSYQSLADVGKTKLSFKEIREIFEDSREKDAVEEEEEEVEEASLCLRKAYLLTKSIPRQSNRTK